MHGREREIYTNIIIDVYIHRYTNGYVYIYIYVCELLQRVAVLKKKLHRHTHTHTHTHTLTLWNLLEKWGSLWLEITLFGTQMMLISHQGPI